MFFFEATTIQLTFLSIILIISLVSFFLAILFFFNKSTTTCTCSTKTYLHPIVYDLAKVIKLCFGFSIISFFFCFVSNKSFFLRSLEQQPVFLKAHLTIVLIGKVNIDTIRLRLNESP